VIASTISAAGMLGCQTSDVPVIKNATIVRRTASPTPIS
jgi:hypothetical protein